MTDVRHGIGLRGYAQRDPLVEYKNEGFSMFDRMLNEIEDNIVRRFYKVRVVKRSPTVDVDRAQAVHEEAKSLPKPAMGAQSPSGVPSKSEDARPGKVSKQKTVVKGRKVGRNEPCPCGSGKKYKKCCYPKYE